MGDPTAQLKECEVILKALGSKRRLAIIRFMQTRKQGTLGEIAEEIKLSTKSTSKHLSVLVMTEILDREQRGMRANFYLSDSMPDLARAVISKL